MSQDWRVERCWNWSLPLQIYVCRVVACCEGVMAPARAGSFNANFAPETLEAFKQHCRQQGKQYTKVLERLAEVYLQTNGALLDGAVPQALPSLVKTSKDRQVQVEVLQNKVLQDLLQRVEFLEKQKEKILYEMDRLQKSVAFIQVGISEPSGFNAS